MCDGLVWSKQGLGTGIDMIEAGVGARVTPGWGGACGWQEVIPLAITGSVVAVNCVEE